MFENKNKKDIFDYNIDIVMNSFSYFLYHSSNKTFAEFKKNYMIDERKPGHSTLRFKGHYIDHLESFFSKEFQDLKFNNEEEKKEDLNDFIIGIVSRIVVIEMEFFERSKEKILKFVVNSNKAMEKFGNYPYPEVIKILKFEYKLLEQFCKVDHTSLKKKDIESFFLYDEMLDNTFYLAQKFIKSFKHEFFIIDLYQKLNIDINLINDRASMNIENMKKNFFSFFTNVPLSEDVDKAVDKNINLKVDAFKNREHFFSFLEELTEGELEQTEKEIKQNKAKVKYFSNLYYILIVSFIETSIINTISSKDLQKAIRYLKKLHKKTFEENQKNEIHKYLLMLQNRDLSFIYLPNIFIAHHLSIPFNYAYNFTKRDNHLERFSDSTKDNFDGNVNKNSFIKYFCIVKKIYFPYHRLNNSDIECLCKNISLKE